MNTEKQHPITQAVKELLKATCYDTAHLSVVELSEDHYLEIGVTVGLEDYAIIVGRGGERINALIELVKFAGENANLAAKLTLRKDENSNRPLHRSFKYNPDFDESLFAGPFYEWCGLVGVPLEGIAIGRNEQECANLQVRIPVPEDDIVTRAKIQDLSHVFWPYGFRNGCRMDIKAS